MLIGFGDMKRMYGVAALRSKRKMNVSQKNKYYTVDCNDYIIVIGVVDDYRG